MSADRRGQINPGAMDIVSLVPAATEILVALGLADRLIVRGKCDLPSFLPSHIALIQVPLVPGKCA